MNEERAQGARCPWCREPLSTEARACPHCTRWQGLVATCAYRLFYHPYSGLLLLLCLVGIQLWGLSSLVSPIWAPHAFGPFAGEVRVTGSKMAPGSLDGRPALAVIGRVRNDSANVWEDPVLEVQFSDAAGRLIDVGRPRLWGQTAPPHGETAFRLTFTLDLPPERYATHRVLVRSARKPNWLF